MLTTFDIIVAIVIALVIVDCMRDIREQVALKKYCNFKIKNSEGKDEQSNNRR